jgi:hypothetical protein
MLCNIGANGAIDMPMFGLSLGHPAVIGCNITRWKERRNRIVYM